MTRRIGVLAGPAPGRARLHRRDCEHRADDVQRGLAAALSTFKQWRLPGAPFLLSAALLLLAVGISVKATAPDTRV